MILDVQKIDLSYNSVDMGICREVFDQITKPQNATSEIYWILKPGGISFTLSPIYYHLDEEHLDYRGFPPYGIKFQLSLFLSQYVVSKGFPYDPYHVVSIEVKWGAYLPSLKKRMSEWIHITVVPMSIRILAAAVSAKKGFINILTRQMHG